ncbi:hypothetical protein [Microbacterium sp. KR10-403]|uniref:hypothetical protein n=1 Tax=Microbacterium sp. KR10-403 TaxID=3158581 RepID=UPI0032E3B3AA
MLEQAAQTGLEWWDERGPVFSTMEHGARVTRIPPGFVFRERATADIAGAVACAVFAALAVWGVSLLFVGPSTDGVVPGGLWWLALVIPAALLSGGIALGMTLTAPDRYGRAGVGGALAATGMAGGIAVGFAVTVLRVDGAMRTVLAVLAAAFLVTALVCVLCTPPALRRAKIEASRIMRLRESGDRFTGRVLAPPDSDTWKGRGPVSIRYDDGAGERTLQATVHATPSRVPTGGTQVLVFTRSPAGVAPTAEGVHIELDTSIAPRFFPRPREYESAGADGGTM